MCVVATTAGCQNARFGRLKDGCPPVADAACAPTVPCPPAQQPCPTPAPKRDAEPTPQPRPATTTREEVADRAAVVNDVLLVPRTVFMPYAPYAPTAPARLRMAAPADQVIEERIREGEPRPAQPRDSKLTETLDKCLDAMSNINNRLTVLENRASTVVAPPPPVYCPPPAAPYCPPGRRVLFPSLHRNLCPPDPCPPACPIPSVECPIAPSGGIVPPAPLVPSSATERQ
jgi:hypothetical protein